MSKEKQHRKGDAQVATQGIPLAVLFKSLKGSVAGINRLASVVAFFSLLSALDERHQPKIIWIGTGVNYTDEKTGETHPLYIPVWDTSSIVTETLELEWCEFDICYEWAGIKENNYDFTSNGTCSKCDRKEANHVIINIPRPETPEYMLWKTKFRMAIKDKPNNIKKSIEHINEQLSMIKVIIKNKGQSDEEIIPINPEEEREEAKPEVELPTVPSTG